MSNGLTKFKNFWDPVPSEFEDELMTGFPRMLYPKEFSRIMNGRCDFEEDDDKFTIQLEVPGVNKDEINLNLKNDVLMISWKKEKKEKHETKKKQGTYERVYGSFIRSFEVEGANPDKIEAQLTDGILKITIPKQEAIKPKQIQIK